MHRITLLSLLIGLPATPLIAGPLSQVEDNRQSVSAMSRVESAEYLLKSGSDVDPLAIDQAEAIIAGKPGKRWKNCIFDKEVARALATNSSAVTAD